MNDGVQGALHPGLSATRAVQATERRNLSGLAADIGTNLVDWALRQLETGIWSSEPCAALSVVNADAIIMAPTARPKIRIDSLFIIDSLGPNVPPFGMLRTHGISSLKSNPAM